ncbi:hypothetical protein HOC80_03345 [archaeon]|jgi:hypothetical protein|nr:hypothetical protein [archaeon]MBT4417112.1 hypothetical protein [archaeon]
MTISYEEYQTRFRMMEKDMHKFYGGLIKKGVWDKYNEILTPMGESMKFLRDITEREYNNPEVRIQIIIHLGILKNLIMAISDKIHYLPRDVLLKIGRMIIRVRAVS